MRTLTRNKRETGTNGQRTDKQGRQEPTQTGQRISTDLRTLAGLTFYEVNIAGQYKDANERLLKDPDGLRAAIEYCNEIEENKRPKDPEA